MSTRVREADIRAERSALVDVLTRELDGWSDANKFDWLYLDNPFGEARCWVLVDDDETIVGVSAAFPRTLRLGARKLRAWVLGDFCVAQKLRSLGPAIQLQRAAFNAIDGGDVDLWYDFPSRSMMAVYQRMGAVRNGELVRLVHLLKTNRAIEQRTGSPMLAKSMSFAGNTVLAARAALTKRDKGVELSVRKTRFDVSPNIGYGLEEGVTLRRSSDYLNWRYLANPSGAVSVLSVTGGGEGSLVYRITGDDDVVEIVDMFGVGDTRALRELVLTVVDEARECGATSVTTALSEEHPWMEVLDELGFQQRDTGPFVVYAREGVMTDPARWYLHGGDRDIY